MENNFCELKTMYMFFVKKCEDIKNEEDIIKIKNELEEEEKKFVGKSVKQQSKIVYKNLVYSQIKKACERLGIPKEKRLAVVPITDQQLQDQKKELEQYKSQSKNIVLSQVIDLNNKCLNNLQSSNFPPEQKNIYIFLLLLLTSGFRGKEILYASDIQIHDKQNNILYIKGICKKRDHRQNIQPYLRKILIDCDYWVQLRQLIFDMSDDDKKKLCIQTNQKIKDNYIHICEKKHDLRGIYCFFRAYLEDKNMNDMNYLISQYLNHENMDSSIYYNRWRFIDDRKNCLENKNQIQIQELKNKIDLILSNQQEQQNFYNSIIKNQSDIILRLSNKIFDL